MAFLRRQLTRAKRWYAAAGRSCLLATLGVLALLATAIPASGQEASLSENQIKAAFLINIPKYVDWPSEAFAQTNSPIVLGVLGTSEVGDELKKMIASKTINGRAVSIKQLEVKDDLSVCHELFVSAGQQSQMPEIVRKLEGKCILTVGESSDFLEQGGMINLMRDGSKIALEVNLTAANQARLKISSRFLSVARLVKGKQN